MAIFLPLPGSHGAYVVAPIRCQGALLSQPTACRSTPVTTAALLPFTVRLDTEGAVKLRLAG